MNFDELNCYYESILSETPNCTALQTGLQTTCLHGPDDDDDEFEFMCSLKRNKTVTSTTVTVNLGGQTHKNFT